MNHELMMIMFGVGVGLLVGATGVGGGSIMTPLLVIVAGVPPVSAIGTDLFYAAVTKTVGGASHFKKSTVDLRLSLQLAVGSVPAALGAVWLLHSLQGSIGVSIDTPLIAAVAVAIACRPDGFFSLLIISPNQKRLLCVSFISRNTQQDKSAEKK